MAQLPEDNQQETKVPGVEKPIVAPKTITPGMLVAGAILIVAGGGLTFLALAMGWIQGPGEVLHRYQVPGDPPITIGDGSLHVHSKFKWLDPDPDPTNHMIIQPLGNPPDHTPSFQTNCNVTDASGNQVSLSAFLWIDDGKLYDISPLSLATWKVKLTHNNGNGPAVTVTARNGVLQISSDKGGFEAVWPHDHDRNNRQHNWPDVISKIEVQGVVTSTSYPLPNGNWMNSNQYPHYTVGFCYY
jgi:hypothetical protein